MEATLRTFPTELLQDVLHRDKGLGQEEASTGWKEPESNVGGRRNSVWVLRMVVPE